MKSTLNQDFFARESWSQVGANEAMIEALRSIGLSRPSHVQAEALQATFSGTRQPVDHAHEFCALFITPPAFCSHARIHTPHGPLLTRIAPLRPERDVGTCAGANRVVVADQAGSGKTLAYLVPLVQALKAEEEAAGGGRLTKPRCPRAVIICPTEELCVQVLYTARALSKVRPRAPPAATPAPQIWHL